MTWRRAGAAALAGVLLLLLLAPAALLVQQQQRTEALLLDRAAARLTGLTELSAQSIDTELSGVQDSVGAWALREELVASLSAGADRDGLRLAEILTGLRLADRNLDGAYAVSPSGRLLMSSPSEPDLYGEDFSSRDWYRGAVSSPGVYVSSAFRARTLDRPWALGVSTAVRDPADGSVLGVIGTIFRLERVQQLVDDHLSALQLQTQVFDQRGALVARTGGLDAGRSAMRAPRVDTLLRRGAAQGRTGGAWASLWSSARLPGGGVVLLQVPQQQVLAGLPERNRQSRLVLLGLLGLLVAAGAVVLRVERGRRRVARALQEREDFLNAVLNGVEADIAACDAAGELTWLRDGAARPGPQVEPGPQPALHAERSRVTDLGGNAVPADEMPMLRVLRGEVVDGWLHLLHDQGSVRTMRASAGPLRRADGTVRGAVVVSHDVTDLIEQQERLRSQGLELAEAKDGLAAALLELQSKQAFLDAVLDHVDTGIVAVGPEGQLLLRNRMQEELVPLAAATGGTGQGRTLLDAHGVPLQVPHDLPALRALRGEVLDREPVRIRCEDGTELLLEVSGAQIQGPDGRLLGAFAAAHDVTRLVRAEQAAREAGALHRAVLAASPDMFFITELSSGRFTYATDSSTAVLGRTAAELQCLDDVAGLVHEEDVPLLRSQDREAAELADGDVLSSRLRIRHADGSWRWLSRRVTPFGRDDRGRVDRVLGVARDVTAHVEAEDELQHAALHDALTGLPNRALLTDRLRTALDRASGTGRQVAVLYVDLDGFKQVNDSAGHAAGDAVLREVAARLRAGVRAQDTVARLGGDEFVVLIEPGDGTTGSGPADESTLRRDREVALATAERVRASVGRPVTVRGREHVVTASTGLAFSGASTAPEDLLQVADAAMYEAKSSGRDRVVVRSAPGLRRPALVPEPRATSGTTLPPARHRRS